MHKDAVIIGGGLSGLVAAHCLSHKGIKSLILEKGPEVGGGNRSFSDKLGNTFDYGYHALDYGRSGIATEFVQKVLKENIVKFALRRGVVLKNYLIPYNAPLARWPDELRKYFERDPQIDDLCGELSRGAVSKVYGENFTHFAFDEILPSYPSLKWSIENGGAEENHFGLIYPWFFPRVPRKTERKKEWDIYHDKMRETGHQEVVYPGEGGFGGFVNAIVEDMAPGFCEIRVNVEDIRFKWDDKNCFLNGVVCGEEGITSDMFFWCAPLPVLFHILGMRVELGKRQKIVLGSFAFENPLGSQYHEILVGSLEYKINRIGFPGKISQKNDNLVQVEFYFPEGEFPLDEDYWEPIWIKSLKRLGIVIESNRLACFTFGSETRGVCTTHSSDSLLHFYKEKYLAWGTNVVVPFFNLGPENINRLVPGVIDTVEDVLKKSDKTVE